MADVALVPVVVNELCKLARLESDVTENALLRTMTASTRDSRWPDAFGLQGETRQSRDRVVRQVPLEFARSDFQSHTRPELSNGRMHQLDGSCHPFLREDNRSISKSCVEYKDGMTAD